MAAYAEETLDKVPKTKIILITLTLQNKVEAYSNVINDALGKFNKNHVKLESKIIILKQVWTLLNKRIADKERQYWENAQYSKWEYLEVIYIPRDVSNKDLEFTVLEAFSKVGCKIPMRDIEACHRLTGNNNWITVKLSWRKDCNQGTSINKNLWKIKLG